jgi:uncharacterized membrane protein
MLRGAPVEVNARRVVQIVSVLMAVTLAALSITFFLSGMHRNTAASNLRLHGVTVSVTTTTCVGELGGSGSNLADYRCQGTFLLNGHRFDTTIPGHQFRATGSAATFITAKNSPGFLATPRDVNRERASWHVYVLPFVLLVFLIVFVSILARRRRKERVALNEDFISTPTTAAETSDP